MTRISKYVRLGGLQENTRRRSDSPGCGALLPPLSRLTLTHRCTYGRAIVEFPVMWTRNMLTDRWLPLGFAPLPPQVVVVTLDCFLGAEASDGSTSQRSCARLASSSPTLIYGGLLRWRLAHSARHPKGWIIRRQVSRPTGDPANVTFCQRWLASDDVALQETITSDRNKR